MPVRLLDFIVAFQNHGILSTCFNSKIFFFLLDKHRKMNSVYFCYQDNIFLADVIGEENICRFEPFNVFIIFYLVLLHNYKLRSQVIFYWK